MRRRWHCSAFHGTHCKPTARFRAKPFWRWRAARAKPFKLISLSLSVVLLDPAAVCPISRLVQPGSDYQVRLATGRASIALKEIVYKISHRLRTRLCRCSWIFSRVLAPWMLTLGGKHEAVGHYLCQW